MTSKLKKHVLAGVWFTLIAMNGCGGGSAPASGAGGVALTPASPIVLDAGQSSTFTATVSQDSSNAGVRWQLQGVGALSSETKTTVVFTAPGSVNSATTSAVEAIAAANNTSSATTLINIFPALAITITSAPAATINTSYALQLTSTGGSGTVTWALASGTLPVGLTISSKGLISGVPTQYGTYSFAVSATDAATNPMVVTQALTIVVNAATLKVSTAALPNTILGQSYSASLAATGGITPYTWTLSSGALPAGLQLSTSGVVSGSATVAGSSTFSVQVADTEAVPQIVTKSFTILVYSKLSVVTTGLPNAAQATAYSQTLQAAGGTTPYTWSIASGVLPAGLTLSSAGVLAGTPSVSGSFSFSVQVTDTSVAPQTAMMSYTLVIVAPLVITTVSLPSATVNNAYSTQLASSGGNPPVSWSLSSGILPHGLTLSSSGLIQGTPSQTETQTFTVQASDTTPTSVTKTFSLSVTALAPLTVTTMSLPNGNVGVAYSAALSATGGAVPYTWSISSGSVPSGLALSGAGVLSGTPSATGTFMFTAQVKDGEATPATATQSFTVVIANAGATAMLKGEYAFLLNGFRSGNAAGTVYGFAEIGSVNLDSAGGVTGVADINSSSGVQLSQAVTGSYSLGTDGRGLMTITVGGSTASYALAASQPVSGVMQSFQLVEFDNADGTGAQASGFAKLQSTASFAASSLTGNFAFGLTGESCSTCIATGFGPVVVAGVMKLDGVSLISSGAEDASSYGHNFSGITLTGAYSAPSSGNGRGTLTFTSAGATVAGQPVDFTYVIVNANEFLLMSNDSHVTSNLLFGDAQMQQQASYAAATEFSGESVGYETQASGGDGVSVYPTATNAFLYQLTNTGSGTSTLFEDSNRGGMFASSSAATAVTYTTAANGRVVVATGAGTSHVVYLYNTGAGFGIDTATSAGYPGAVRYELVVKPAAALPPLPAGTFAAGTSAMPVRAAVSSGVYLYSPSGGGADTTVINGSLAKSLDTSTAVGGLTTNQTSTVSTAESASGRQVETTTPTSTTPTAVTYVITSTHAVSIPVGGTQPGVINLQQ